MATMIRKLAAAVVTCVSIAALPATAAPIAIVNGDFEDPAQVLDLNNGIGPFANAANGWVLTGEGGTWAPIPGGLTFSADPGVAIGERIGWVGDGALSQTLSTSFSASTNYELSVDVGNRLDGFGINGFPDGTMSIFAGNTVNVVKSANLSVPPEGQFIPQILSLTAADIEPFIGMAIGILFSSPRLQINVDNVSLTANTQVPNPVPLPAAGWLLLMALGSLASLSCVRWKFSG